MGILRQLVLLLPLAAFPAAAHAGVVIDMETRDVASGSTTTAQMSVDGKFVRTQVRENGRGGQKSGGMSEMIYHPAAAGRGPEMIIISHDEKAYRVMDEQTFKRLGSMMSGQAGAANSAMAEAMKRLTPEQRAAVMQRMPPGAMPGAPAPSTREIRATGRTDKVDGIACKIWEKWEAGAKTAEYCAAGASAFPYGTRVMPAFLDMSAFMKRMFESMPAASRAADDSMALLKEIDGVPVRTRTFDNGALESESTFKGAREQALEASFFQPPAGYKKLDVMSGR
ncbi:hypothetical protein [Emcibacter sp. SYSU 3D8]|uniref:hypothetical protein n=1 Tax=Emcibacter sp. SYSU 3D8 TaxID=3133969 RepID=UPI0031FF4606